ncbi:MAG: acyltransferase [Eubacterium sp.]|nr:acyltransferase [Eubacterium sp.]
MVEKNQVHPLNVYRTVSVLIVFMLHAWIFSMSLGFTYDRRTWFLKTPAWAGVWLFFLLSGYLMGKGFLTGRYKQDGRYTGKSILQFYIRRIVKVGVPAWMFCILSIILLDPEFFIKNKTVVFTILTFRYVNDPASNIIGATWYVSSLMWLYLCVPFLCMLTEALAERIKYRKSVMMGIFFVVTVLGLVLRLIMYQKGLPWSPKVYVPFYCNLDIYICGLLINYMERDFEKKEKAYISGVLSFVVLLTVVVLNSGIYFLSETDRSCLFICQYICPTIYIYAGTYFLMRWGNYNKKQADITWWNVCRNPLRLMDAFAGISFEFYLVHSMVYNSIYRYLNTGSPLENHLLLLLCAFVISAALSVLMHRAFQPVRHTL